MKWERGMRREEGKERRREREDESEGGIERERMERREIGK
jgi:hypothetical protein